MTMSAELVETLERLDLIYLKHRGRKTGREYSTEISFAVDADGVYLLANLENGGRRPDWLLNVLAAGEASFYAGTRLVSGQVELLAGESIPSLQQQFRNRYGGEIVRRWYDPMQIVPVRISELKVV
jgi:deazaflavin-dependent oxidoreductase (nitroreductase family)